MHARPGGLGGPAADSLAVVGCLTYAAFGLTLLSGLDYNFDEGVYIQQARLVMAGQRPYVDFFYHQTPLYLYTLALAGAPAPESLFPYRLVSLVATSLCGLFVYLIGRRLMPPAGALLAGSFFFYPALQRFGLVALPNALMLLTATAGMYLLWWGETRLRVVLGSLLLVVSVLYKPLSLPVVLAVGVAVIASPAQRWKVLPAALAGAGSGLGAWLAFHLATGGVFTEVLVLQAGRYAGKGGFAIMSSFETFRRVMAENSLETPFDWNLYEHVRTFLVGTWRNANFHLFVLAAAGQALVWWRSDARKDALLFTLWWLLPFAVSLYVWEPNWDHYYVQYLPPFALLGAIFLAAAWNARPGRQAVRAVVVVIALASLTGPLYLRTRTTEYWEWHVEEWRGQRWLTFDPFLNLITGTEPACGAWDVFNVYGEESLTADSELEIFSRHHVGAEELAECLRRNPDVKIGIGYWGEWFVDERLRRVFDELPCERFVLVRKRYVF